MSADPIQRSHAGQGAPAANYDAWLEQHRDELEQSRKKSFESSSGIPVIGLAPQHRRSLLLRSKQTSARAQQ